MADPALPSAPLVVPDGWQVLPAPPPGATWVAVEPADPEDPDRFRANLVLTAVPAGGLGFRDWQVGTDELLPRLLEDFLLVDLERVDIDGAPGGRRLAHHAAGSGEALTMEQWFTLVDGVGHTLTATVETWRYDALADVCGAVARSWRPAGPADPDGRPDAD